MPQSEPSKNVLEPRTNEPESNATNTTLRLVAILDVKS